jgi:hypothetical protein
MKKIIIFLLLMSTIALSQKAVESKQITRQKPVIAQKKQVHSTSQVELKNIHNDKYMKRYNYQNNNQTTICESYNGNRVHCKVNTRYGINFLRQLSRSSCDYNWGYDNTGIWVDRGCRAEFSVNYGWNQTGSEGNIMICESHEFKRNYCPAHLDGREVFLLNQLSQSYCQNNWGYDRNGIWVSNGCRAEFVIEDRHYTQNDIVVCSSRNLQFQSCRADTRGGVEFIRQLSRSSCNGNWGYNRQGIWVTNGCRAKFKLIKYNNYGNNGGQHQSTVKCYSRKHRRKTCAADTSGGVRLQKQKSKVSCRGNWGYSHNQIWVDRGCRAIFQLHVDDHNYGNNGYGNGNQGNGNYGNNGYGNQGNGNHGNNGHNNQNTIIRCESKNLQRTSCIIPHDAKVRMTKQLSHKSCVKNWGYNKHEIWVANGCRAEFNIY